MLLPKLRPPCRRHGVPMWTWIPGTTQRLLTYDKAAATMTVEIRKRSNTTRRQIRILGRFILLGIECGRDARTKLVRESLVVATVRWARIAMDPRDPNSIREIRV